MSNKPREETIMKKLAVIAIAVIAFGAVAAVAHAKPTPATHAKPVGMSHAYGVQAPVRGENYYARGIPTSTPNTIVVSPSTSTNFQWGDAGIGAGIVFGLTALLAVGVAFRRHQLHVGPA
jgi:hypothetical protein